MKKNILRALLLLLVLATTSCRYEEGPYVSFISPENRIVGYWELSHVKLNGNEITTSSNPANQVGNYYAFFIERMLSVTTIINQVRMESVSGYWEFSDNEKELIVNFVLANKTYSYIAKIKLLSSKELIYEYTDENGDSWRLQFDNRS
ncbi:MAG: hypothetical protein PHQ33_05380 [Bacteroidales bacterium]|nr:hypothetical protein [Bacteroidales bacterium]